jgi:hypothetical protein
MKLNKAIARARQSFHESLFGLRVVRLGIGVTGASVPQAAVVGWIATGALETVMSRPKR